MLVCSFWNSCCNLHFGHCCAQNFVFSTPRTPHFAKRHVRKWMLHWILKQCSCRNCFCAEIWNHPNALLQYFAPRVALFERLLCAWLPKRYFPCLGETCAIVILTEIWNIFASVFCATGGTFCTTCSFSLGLQSHCCVNLLPFAKTHYRFSNSPQIATFPLLRQQANVCQRISTSSLRCNGLGTAVATACKFFPTFCRKVLQNAIQKRWKVI